MASRDDIVRIEKRTQQRGPGRPRSVPVMPVDEHVQQVMRMRKNHVEDDTLVNEVRNNPDSFDVLDKLMENFATEAASLQFDRQEAERKDQDTTTFASKRVTALKALGQTWIKKRDMIVDEAFDFDSKRFQTLFKFWLKKVRRAADNAGLNEEQIQSFFKQLEVVFDGWEDDARSYIKQRF